MENKLVNSTQCTLVCYVDERKVSHMKAKIVEDLIGDLKKYFGELVVTIGNQHTSLGMNINTTEDKKVEIEMKYKLLETIEESRENIDEKLTSPASIHIFIVNKQAQKLDEEKSESFHLVVAKILYIMIKLIPDLETVISLLCRIVSKSDVDD